MITPMARRSDRVVGAAWKRTGGLMRKYFLIIVFLVSGGLLTSSLVELYVAKQENETTLSGLQQHEAAAAATTIEQFVKGIERQIGWTLQPAWLSEAVATEQRRYEFNRVLRLTPAVTTISFLDRSGAEQIRISRLAVNVIGSRTDYTRDPRFLGPKLARPISGRSCSGTNPSRTCSSRWPKAGWMAASSWPRST